MPFAGHYGGLAPLPKRCGGRAPDEELYLESFKRAFPDVYSRETTSLVVAEHIAHAREKASVGRAIAAVVKDSLPHTAHLSLLDWANKLGVAVQPDWGPGDLARACVEIYEARAENDIVTLRSELSRLLGDSFVALKRPLDKSAKVISCCATSAGSAAGLTPVYPLVDKSTILNTSNSTSATVAECVAGPAQEVEFGISAPGSMSAMLSVAIVGDSVWAPAYDVATTASTGALTDAVTAVDDCTALIVFVVARSSPVDYSSVTFNGAAMTFVSAVTVDDGSSDTDLHIAAYTLASGVAGVSANVSVTVNTLTGTNANVKLFWALLEGLDSSTSASDSDSATTGSRLTTEHTVDTDVATSYAAPEPTYWEGNPAPEALAAYVLDGWTSARARYHLQARRASTYTSDDAVRQQIDGPVHTYLDRVLKSTECYDYSIGDLEGFIIGVSRMGYVALGSSG